MWECSSCNETNNDSNSTCSFCGISKRITQTVDNDIIKERVGRYSKKINELLINDQYDEIINQINSAKKTGIDEADLPISINKSVFLKENIVKIEQLKKKENYKELVNLYKKFKGYNPKSKFIKNEIGEYNKFNSYYIKIYNEIDVENMLKIINEISPKLAGINKYYRKTLEKIFTAKRILIKKEEVRKKNIAIIKDLLIYDRYDKILKQINIAIKTGINETDLPINIKKTNYLKENISNIELLKKKESYKELVNIHDKFIRYNPQSKFIKNEIDEYKRFCIYRSIIVNEKDVKILFKSIKDISLILSSVDKSYRKSLEKLIISARSSIEQEWNRLNILKTAQFKNKQYIDAISTLEDLCNISENTKIYKERIVILRESIPFLSGSILKEINIKNNFSFCEKKRNELTKLIAEADPLYKDDLKEIDEILKKKK